MGLEQMGDEGWKRPFVLILKRVPTSPEAGGERKSPGVGRPADKARERESPGRMNRAVLVGLPVMRRVTKPFSFRTSS